MPVKASTPGRAKKLPRGKRSPQKAEDAPVQGPNLWDAQHRPSTSGDPHPTHFTLLNEPASTAAGKLLSCVCITAPEARGNPVVHVSGGFETTH